MGSDLDLTLEQAYAKKASGWFCLLEIVMFLPVIVLSILALVSSIVLGANIWFVLKFWEFRKKELPDVPDSKWD